MYKKQIPFVFLSLFAVILFTGCDGSSSSGAGTLTFMEDALTPSELRANNQVEASPEQIRTDLEFLADLENLPGPSVPGGIQLSRNYGYAGRIGNVLAKRKIGEFAARECTTLDQDTSYFEDGMQFTEQIRGYDKNGNRFRICEGQFSTLEDYFAYFDGARTEAISLGRSDQVDQDTKTSMTIHVKNAQRNPTLEMEGNAYSYFQVKSPNQFSLYMEMNFAVTGLTEDDDEGDGNFDFTLWLMDGRYICEASESLMSGDESGKMCDLVNANKVVGSLHVDRYGSTIVYDADEKVVRN